MQFFRATIVLMAAFFITFTLLKFDLFSPEQLEDPAIFIEDSIVQNPHLYPLSGGVVQAFSGTGSATSARIQSNYTLELSELGVSVPIMFEQSTNANKILKTLNYGVVHYSSTPKPGEWGTSIIVGHSSAPRGYFGKYSKVFSNLSKLDEGDTFTIYKDGQKMIFSVSKKIIFDPKNFDSGVLKEFERPSGTSVILMTCWPTGTAANRVAVRGELISV